MFLRSNSRSRTVPNMHAAVAGADTADARRPTTMRIEDRTVGFGDLTDIPVRIYWPPIEHQTDLPIVAFYHGGAG